MKRMLLLLLVLSLLLALAGCGSEPVVCEGCPFCSGELTSDQLTQLMADVEALQEKTELLAQAPAVETPAATEPPVLDEDFFSMPDPMMPDADLSDKAVFRIQTDTIQDEAGRWLVDHAVGDYKEATDADVTFVDSMGWFEGSALSMLAKPNADYNLFWQVDPQGVYTVDTGLDPATTKLALWIYVEDVDAFYQSDWTEVDIGSGGWFGEEWANWQLKDEWITKGWNYLEFKLSDADENTGVDLSRLRWFRFCFVGAPEGMEFRIGDVKLISDIPAAG